VSSRRAAGAQLGEWPGAVENKAFVPRLIVGFLMISWNTIYK